MTTEGEHPQTTTRTGGDDAFVERASMVASFTSIKRTLIAGLVTASVVVSTLLITGGAPVRVTVAVVLLLVAARAAAAWTAKRGLEAETYEEQLEWTQRLERALIPMGALSGLAPTLIPMEDGQITPQWFGLLVCAVAVVASNVLLGYGRSRTFLSLVLPVLGGTAVSAALVGGVFGLAFGPGALLVGAILIYDNREAGAMFRDARRFEEANRALVSELRGANESLDHRAHTDALTGLSNRAGLRRHVETRGEDGGTIEVIYLDLDGFKQVNDQHGHAAGDAVLATVGERLSRAVRSRDCAARLGGDEFVVIATVDAQDEAPLADRIRAVLELPITFGDVDLELGMSIGSQRGKPGDDISRVMRRADAAMYEQKRSRRRENGIAQAGDGLDTSLR